MQAASISEYLTRDHERLDELLAELIKIESLSVGAAQESHIYREFKSGMLAHIRIEETELLPMVRVANNNEPIALASKLRLDHGAIAALLVPPPNREILRAIRIVLDAHNPLEEEPGGAYDACDALLTSEDASRILHDFEAMPPVPFSKTVNSTVALESAARALERAGFSRSLVL